MDIINQIKDGVHLDNNVYDQPEGSMRESINGVITGVFGNYKWTNIRGNALSFVLTAADKYFAHCLIRSRLIIISLDDVGQIVKLWEVSFTDHTGATSVLWTGSNAGFNLSFDHPIRAIWGFYENEDTQRIYFTDYNNSPRCINIGSGAIVAIDEKFTKFTPVISKVYGSFMLLDLTGAGTVKAGTVFFAWRYYINDGYYTDWSYLTSPVQIAEGSPGATFMAYQNMQGGAPDENTGKSVRFRISDADTDYDNIQICAFYSNDLNISIPGVIIYDGAITAATMDFTYKGSENLGTVTIDDLISTSLVIDKCKDMVFAKKQNVIACVKERDELDVSALNPEGKQGYLPADIAVTKRRVLLDETTYPTWMATAASDKALTGLKTSSYNASAHYLRRGQWYQAITEVQWSEQDPAIPASTYTIPAGNVFYISIYSAATLWIAGTYKACIVVKKYLKAGGNEFGDVNTEYVFDVIQLDNEYPDYKSAKVTNYYKSYPQGEKVRLGVLFFDKTGRPFAVRHLRNSNASGFGLGDTDIPKRSLTNPLLDNLMEVTSGGDFAYGQANAILQILEVSDLDITEIKDDIGGFMIVRAPIERQYLGMGLLNPTLLSGSDVYSMPGYYFHAASYPGVYDFHCPEDLFSLKDFALLPGDELENLLYLQPYYANEDPVFGGGSYQGLGHRESITYDFYQKMFRPTAAAYLINGAPGALHEIRAVTKYVIGDDNVPIDPLDATKLYKGAAASYNDGAVNHVGTNGNHSVVVLDIDEAAFGMKGTPTAKSAPKALLCAVKRANADPYAGYDDSSIANSLYIATGHFQEINANVLAEVATIVGGQTRYIFNNIEVFGGDTFINLFDVKRIYLNEDIGFVSFGQSVIFPVESKINLAMREGVHVAKDRSYDAGTNASGIRMKVGFTKLEEFNYNDGYSTDNINDFYLPVPYNFTPPSIYDMRLRFSPEKNYGERRDNFRVFFANDYIDLDPNQGPVTNIRYKNNRVVYWQPDEVGYIPIKERALTQNSVGQPVQLGVGGIFERYDQLIDKIGNSNQFGLIESPSGYHWYDAKRKLFVSMNSGLQISKDSILLGADTFFQILPDNFSEKDNPMKDVGMISGYDPMSKMIFCTFYVDAQIHYTIAVHTLFNKYMGKIDLYPRAYINVDDNMICFNDLKTSAYVQGFGSYGNFFGTQYKASVSIIIKEPSNEAKIYDIFELIGSANFFTKILYENSGQSIEEVVASYATGICVPTTRNLSYDKRRWLGNFPKVSRERLADGYLKVTFKMDVPYHVALTQLKTTVRKQY